MSFIQELFTSRNNGANGDDFVGKQGRIWWDPTTNCFYYSDGITPGGIPIGGPPPTVFGELFSETQIATADQTEFLLAHTPSGSVISAINGATVPSDSIINTGSQVIYSPLNNDGYVLVVGDEITFTYLFGTANVSTLGQLGDVNLSTPMNGSVLMYNSSTNLWVAGNPQGSSQTGIQNGTTSAKITDADGSVTFTVAGQVNKAVISTAGINITNGGYRVNGNLAVNGPTIKIENKNSTTTFDACDRPIVVPYQQNIPLDVPTRVEYARLCWDTADRFNPTANIIQIAGVSIQPWSWRPLVPGYYQVVADITLEAETTATPATSTSTTAMVSNLFEVIDGQTEFVIDSMAAGTVIFVLNGATINNTAITVDGTTVTYDPANNDNYEIVDSDEVVIYYISASPEPIPPGFVRLLIEVNGTSQILGARFVSIGGQYTATVAGILPVLAADNISVSVLQTDTVPLKVVYSSLSAAMIRGIE